MSVNKDEIILRGLKENNLKNIDLNLSKEKIIVFTGLSGSGKSSVVYDTLATESRRQMTLNYPHYIRNQMPKFERPQADLMQNLSPVVVVEQRQTGGIPVLRLVRIWMYIRCFAYCSQESGNRQLALPRTSLVKVRSEVALNAMGLAKSLYQI